MKRFFSTILCILMIASLAACSNNEPATTDNTNNTESTATTAYTPEVSESNSLLLGNCYGNSYNNTLMNIGISFPNDWILSTTAELAQMNNMEEQEMLTNFDSLMEESQVCYLLQASDPTGENNVNIVLDNLKLSDNANITGAEYIEITKETTKETLQQLGCANVMSNSTSVYIGGREYAVQRLSYMLEETPIYQEQIHFPLGNYMGILTLTGNTEDILSRIYPLN